MTPVPVLRGQRLVLRTPRESDKRDRLACGRNPEEVRMYGGDHRDLPPLTPEEVERWYARQCAEPLGWMIELGDRCIGTARLHSLDEANRRARYAIGIFDATAWSRGYGTEATRLVLRYAFTTLALHRVDLRVLDYNHRAIACYEKCGFIREGIEREGALVAGEWHSDMMMSILEHEYREVSRSWPETMTAAEHNEERSCAAFFGS